MPSATLIDSREEPWVPGLGIVGFEAVERFGNNVDERLLAGERRAVLMRSASVNRVRGFGRARRYVEEI